MCNRALVKSALRAPAVCRDCSVHPSSRRLPPLIRHLLVYLSLHENLYSLPKLLHALVLFGHLLQ